MKHLTAFNIKEYLANTPQITFEVTEACNLACVYCGYGSLYNDKDPRSNRKLCAIDAISFLKYMKTLWNEGYRGTESNVLHISFYGGEPLLNMPLIKKIVDYSERELRKYKKVIIYSLTTNALLLPINIEYLVSKEFRILISLDGNREGNKYRIYQNSNIDHVGISRILPVWIGDNSDWFNHNVMMTLQDIDTTKLSYDDLFRNEKLNSSCFGILEILSDGHIYALNAKKQLGTTSTYLSEIVEKELRENTSWRITRKVYDGCRNCRYRILCPPVSSYEMLYKTTPKCLIKK